MNPYISQFGETFDAEKSSQYRMAIQFSLGGLSYALLDIAANAVVGVEFHQTEDTDSDNAFRLLEHALESRNLNDRPFESVVSVIDERFNVIVPELISNESNDEQFVNFAFSLPQGYKVRSEKIGSIGASNAFAVSQRLATLITAKWSQAAITHSSSILINKVAKNPDVSGVFVNVRNRDFDMVVLKNGQLIFFNNFRFNTKEDFAYFLLYAMAQNQLSGLEVPVTFVGMLLPASEIVGLCGRYIKDIHFVEAPETLQISESLKEVPFQYYFIHYQALRLR